MAKDTSLHPMSLGVRLLMELTAFAGFGYWGWQATDSGWRYLLAVVLPVAAMALWGIFAVPGDRSRSGKTVVATPGALRLVLELTVLLGGAAAFIAAGATEIGLAFAGIVVLYHVIARDRITWLLRQ